MSTLPYSSKSSFSISSSFKPFIVFSFLPELKEIRALVWSSDETLAISTFIAEAQLSSKLKNLHDLQAKDCIAFELTPTNKTKVDFFFTMIH